MCADRVFSGVIALDGPSGTGKSTVARGLAVELGAGYLDTGAMYRAATVAILRAGLVGADERDVLAELDRHRLEITTDPVAVRVTLDGEDVGGAIRSPETTAAVSAVSALPGVRDRLVAQQRRLISRGPMVAEGRDVGSVVWPQAELKVYLTASEDVRARRRAGELGSADVDDIAELLRRRDEFDSRRAVSPLTRADGAVEVDTSELTIAGVIAVLLELADSRVRA